MLPPAEPDQTALVVEMLSVRSRRKEAQYSRARGSVRGGSGAVEIENNAGVAVFVGTIKRFEIQLVRYTATNFVNMRHSPWEGDARGERSRTAGRYSDLDTTSR